MMVKLLSKYRSEIMGICIISIMLFHSGIDDMYRLFPLHSSPEDFETLQITKRNPASDDTEMFFSYIGYYAHVEKKLLLTELIKSNHLTFPETIKCGEDSCFMLDYLSCCRRVSSIKEIVYYNNRLFDNTGGMKYYPERHVWAEVVMKKYSAVVNEFLPASEATIVISREAAKTINKICNKHIENGASVGQTNELINQTYSALKPFVAYSEFAGEVNIQKSCYDFFQRRQEMNRHVCENQVNSNLSRTNWGSKAHS